MILGMPIESNRYSIIVIVYIYIHNHIIYIYIYIYPSCSLNFIDTSIEYSRKPRLDMEDISCQRLWRFLQSHDERLFVLRELCLGNAQYPLVNIQKTMENHHF